VKVQSDKMWYSIRKTWTSDQEARSPMVQRRVWCMTDSQRCQQSRTMSIF